ncbi:N-acetylmuramoyl-L-alanine amidase [Barnesiella sp. An55]|uniref:N-acetylmuramoyl-L-alanine amidase n=1 Tax=Barnesiella sp. An55 TaxID=1965646 RepID=UPI000B3ADEF4|nr:N-acetylmuramoyl-L-alanine amidase [Barnesiella sp. An55]OUN73720.1 N-acetylmuramoyl-L-alanine amidase [Barnesiella sp. An55]
MLTILLDNGHGNNTPGKKSPVWPDGRQLLEWEFNRDIVARIAHRLDEAGIACHRLVPEENDIALAERCRRANQLARQGDCLLVSVHANAGGGSGGEVFTYPGAARSLEYARIFGQRWPFAFPHLRFRGCKEANFAILRESICPALLTENLFMDNESDCQILLSTEGRDTIARWHVDSIQQILQQFYSSR